MPTRRFKCFFLKCCCPNPGWIVSIFLCVTQSLAAPPKLPSIFTDHMVLQADTAVPVWGEAEAGEAITVRFAGQTKTATADGKGQWIVGLDAMAPSAESRDLTVQGNADSRTYTDVLVGEVWLCSGQSNMFRPLGRIAEQAKRFPGVTGGDAAADGPVQPLLRLYCDDRHELWNAAGWRHADATYRRPFSAVAYFFGTAIQRELRVPVGLIHISRGGTPVQSWTPGETAAAVPFVKQQLDLLEKNRAAINKALRSEEAKAKKGKAKEAVLSEEMQVARRFNGSVLYDDLIEPAAPFGIRGFLWYQGEANSAYLSLATHYDVMLQALVSGWRERWQQPKLPFYFVQLPCWDRGEYWPMTRQSMLNASRIIPDSGMAVTVDFGDATNLHPPQKLQAGERLANLALAKTYGRDVACEGPTVRQATRDGANLRVQFHTGGKSLVVKGGQWTELELSGKDGVFKPARARVEGTEAVVSAAGVAEPTAMRYGWKPVFEPTLFNDAGLPAAPFAFVLNADGKISFDPRALPAGAAAKAK